MTAIQLAQNNRSLVQVFKHYSKRYLSMGKKLNIRKFLPEDLYSTMRLEGEKVTKRAVQALFR